MRNKAGAPLTAVTLPSIRHRLILPPTEAMMQAGTRKRIRVVLLIGSIVCFIWSVSRFMRPSDEPEGSLEQAAAQGEGGGALILAAGSLVAWYMLRPRLAKQNQKEPKL